MKTVRYLLPLLISVLWFGFSVGAEDECRILSVMSYDPDFYWSKELSAGLESATPPSCKIRYVYLDTWRSKDKLEMGKAKAKEAYAVYQEWKPTIVIASDDNAQSMFVVPYLKDKSDTPVVFCGVNSDLETYGYPTENITGVREVVHYRESISFLQQLIPSVRVVGFVMLDRPTSRAFKKQHDNEFQTYPATSAGFRLVQDINEAYGVIDEFKKNCDALFLEHFEGLPDENGNPLTEKEATTKLIERFGGPTFCSNENTVKLGALCAVVKLAEKQGRMAGEMAAGILSGMKVSSIPVSKNDQGKAVLNVDVMKSLGIRPAPGVLVGVEIVKKEP